MLWPRAVARAVAGAVGHQAGLQTAVPAHGPVQVQPGDERLADVHVGFPVHHLVQGGEGPLEADSEDQLLLHNHQKRHTVDGSLEDKKLKHLEDNNVINKQMLFPLATIKIGRASCRERV